MAQQDIKQIIRRLEKLEAAVFGGARPITPHVVGAPDSTAYEGLPGGLQLLADEGFFDSPHKLGNVRNELASHGYHYSRQAVHNTLSRLAKQGGLLVAVKKGQLRLYAKRK